MTNQITAGGAIFARLKVLGVDYVFTGSGTDHPPIIEGLAEANAKGIALPEPMVIPYEHCAVAMAHGSYLANGRTQAVILHTNVGLANGAIGLINAAADNIPMIVMSGRTPTTESGRVGSRDIPIGWGQEMRDQTALVREAVKWDYELRFPEQVPDVLDRAYAIANSTPKGPVYITLPREVLCEPCPADGLSLPPTLKAATVHPSSADISQLADFLAGAKRPLICAQRGAGSKTGFDALARLTQDWAIPVVQYWGERLAIASDHPMQAGDDPASWITEADAILVLNSLAPWSPQFHKPPEDCKVFHVGPDPLQSRTPIRGFRSDLSIVAETGDAIVALADAMAPMRNGHQSTIDDRRTDVVSRTTDLHAAARESARSGNASPMTKAWVGHCLSQAIKGRKASIVHELGSPLSSFDLSDHGTWFLEPLSGGLGWGLPCALGLQLADRERLIVATVGDGSYMFANPVPCHQIAEHYDLPIVTIVLNNAAWGTVRRSVLAAYPDGYASKTEVMPLTGLSPSPDFVRVAEASHAYTEKVVDGDDLPSAIERAINAAVIDRRQALLDVAVEL